MKECPRDGTNLGRGRLKRGWFWALVEGRPRPFRNERRPRKLVVRR